LRIFYFLDQMIQLIQIIWYIFLASAAILLIYNLVSLLSILFYNKKFKNHSQGVSVVICAINELENLKELIPQLLQQTYKNFELIIVDDRSDDDTYYYLKTLADENEKIKHVRIDSTPDHINEKKYAIFLGVKASTNDIVLLTDSDCRPASTQWIAKMTQPFSQKNTKIVLGFSPYEKTKGLLGNYIIFETFLTAISYFTFAMLGRPYMGVGRNMAYRKSFFLENEGFKGFQKVLGGDDDLFVNKNAKKDNTAVVLDSEAKTVSKPKNSWDRYFVQKTRHLSVGKYYKKGDRFLLGVLFISKLLFWLTFIPVIVAEFKPIWTLSGFIGVLVLFLTSYIVFRKKLKDSKGAWNIILLDIIHIFYYLSVGLKVKFTKKVKWS